MSQKELAEILEIDPTTLSLIENGKVINMKKRTKKQIDKFIQSLIDIKKS